MIYIIFFSSIPHVEKQTKQKTKSRAKRLFYDITDKQLKQSIKCYCHHSMAHTAVFWLYPLLFYLFFVSSTAHHSSNENAHKDRLCGCCPRAIRYSCCTDTNNCTASLCVSLHSYLCSSPSLNTSKDGGISTSEQYTFFSSAALSNVWKSLI